MITRIKRADIPCPGGRSRSEMRDFARKTLEEFIESTEVGDIVEVTGFPTVRDDQIANAERFMSALETEAYHLECRQQTRRFRRKGRVFIERMREPQKAMARPKPNPYPYD